MYKLFLHHLLKQQSKEVGVLYLDFSKTYNSLAIFTNYPSTLKPACFIDNDVSKPVLRKKETIAAYFQSRARGRMSKTESV